MVALFMGLCEEAGIVPTGTARRRNTTTARPRRSAVPQGGEQPKIPEVPSPPPLTPSTTQQEVVELASGGTMTVILDANMWRISKDDETFILDLMHRIREYQEVRDKPTEASVAQDGAGKE